MRSMFNDEDRSSMVARIDRVSSGAQARWGKMNAEQMLAHLVESMRMAMGEISPKPKKLPLRYFPLKQLVIYWLPFPKGAPTAPELLVRRATDWQAECADLKHLLERLGAMEGAREWPDHPAFGRMASRDWGTLVHRHVDHHLRQFRA